MSLASNGYGWVAFSNNTFQQRISSAVEEIKKLIKQHEIDAIAFTGSSGSALAFNIASRINIGLLYIRKEKESRNSTTTVECNTHTEIRNYLIVDDFICMGETVRRIARSIEEVAISKNTCIPKCKGIYLYDDEDPYKEFSVCGNTVPVFALKFRH
jgi:orotate phosphoribosyltransferase